MVVVSRFAELYKVVTVRHAIVIESGLYCDRTYLASGKKKSDEAPCAVKFCPHAEPLPSRQRGIEEPRDRFPLRLQTGFPVSSRRVAMFVEPSREGGGVAK